MTINEGDLASLPGLMARFPSAHHNICVKEAPQPLRVKRVLSDGSCYNPTQAITSYAQRNFCDSCCMLMLCQSKALPALTESGCIVGMLSHVWTPPEWLLVDW